MTDKEQLSSERIREAAGNPIFENLDRKVSLDVNWPISFIHMDIVHRAALAYADLLDGDALVIERDERGIARMLSAGQRVAQARLVATMNANEGYMRGADIQEATAYLTTPKGLVEWLDALAAAEGEGS